MEVQFHVFLISALDWGEWWVSRPGRITSGTHWIVGCVGPKAGNASQTNLNLFWTVGRTQWVSLQDLTVQNCSAIFRTYSTVQDILWKADSHSASQTKGYCLDGIRWVFTVCTRARHCTLSSASRIQFAPSIPISLRYILMLFSHLRLGLPSIAYLRASQQKPRINLSPPCHMSRPPHHPLFNYLNNIRWRI
jgi:hypothetical protein